MKNEGGFLGDILKVAASPFTALSSGLTNVVSGSSDLSDLASGLPFVGQGFAAKQQREFEGSQAQQQMAFQERMASTAHQRQVKDLEKAGLNKILAAGGQGASSPGGAKGSAGIASGGSDSAALVNSIMKGERDKNRTAAKLNTQMQQTQKALEASHMSSAVRGMEEYRHLKTKFGSVKAESGFKKKAWQDMGKTWKKSSKGFEEINNVLNMLLH